MAKKPTRILGIDFGLARLGVALSDESHTLATGKETLVCSKKAEVTAKSVVTLIQKLEKDLDCTIVQIVVGLPLMMNGSVGLLADETKHFTQILQSLVTIPVHLWDERLTTVQAEKVLKEAGLSRKKRTKYTDQLAAVLILQNFLDHASFRKDFINEKI